MPNIIFLAMLFFIGVLISSFITFNKNTVQLNNAYTTDQIEVVCNNNYYSNQTIGQLPAKCLKFVK